MTKKQNISSEVQKYGIPYTFNISDDHNGKNIKFYNR